MYTLLFPQYFFQKGQKMMMMRFFCRNPRIALTFLGSLDNLQPLTTFQRAPTNTKDWIVHRLTFHLPSARHHLIAWTKQRCKQKMEEKWTIMRPKTTPTREWFRSRWRQSTMAAAAPTSVAMTRYKASRYIACVQVLRKDVLFLWTKWALSPGATLVRHFL